MTWPTKTDFVDGDVLTATQVNNIGTNLNEADPTGITDGYVLTADGAGGMGWEAIVANSLTQIATGSLSGTSVSITSIPSGYKALLLHLYMFDIPSGAGVSFQYNGNTTSNYSSITYRRFQSANSAYGYNGHPQIEAFFGGNGATTNGNLVWQMVNYADYTALRTCQFYASGQDNTGARSVYGGGCGELNNSAAITSIEIKCSSTGFTAGTYYLYGVN
jgi:hypothetical protein